VVQIEEGYCIVFRKNKAVQTIAWALGLILGLADQNFRKLRSTEVLSACCKFGNLGCALRDLKADF